MVDGDDLLYQNVNRKYTSLVFLVDHQCPFIQAMIRHNLSSVTVLELIDASNEFAPYLRGSSEEKNVVDITVVAEWIGLDDNFL